MCLDGVDTGLTWDVLVNNVHVRSRTIAVDDLHGPVGRHGHRDRMCGGRDSRVLDETFNIDVDYVKINTSRSEDT